MNKPTIELIFPTSVMFNKIDRDFSQEELDFVAKHSQDGMTNKNIGNVTSNNNYILEEPEFADLKNIVTQHINEYIQTVMKPKYVAEGYVTQSWLNYTKKGEFHHQHSHPNSFISGVLYIQTNETEDKIKFHRSGYTQLQLLAREYDNMNSDSWWFTVKTGNIVLFPSSLVHEVEKVTTDETRISIAFNTFVRGTLGDNSMLTEFKIG